jgi:uncharacterized protein YneF (UPF0154 family)
MLVAEVIGIVLLIWVVFAGGYYLGRRSAVRAIWDESSEIEPPPITMVGIDRRPSPW